jgi:hypothetical protein
VSWRAKRLSHGTQRFCGECADCNNKYKEMIMKVDSKRRIGKSIVYKESAGIRLQGAFI